MEEIKEPDLTNWYITGLAAVIIVLIVAFLLSGCAWQKTDLRKGTVESFTFLKTLDANNVNYVLEPNGRVSCQIKGMSNVSSYADSMLGAICGAVVTILTY